MSPSQSHVPMVPDGEQNRSITLSSDEMSDMPLACSLSAQDLRERTGENTMLFARARARTELADGYCFTFAADEAQDLLGFVLAERACCPFFTFELSFPSPHEVVLLTVRGGAEVKEIVREMAASN
jgi:hypothetical protein